MTKLDLSVLALFAAVLAFAASGCSADDAGAASPCRSSSPPAACMQACGGAMTCPAGFYCAGTGHCNADCDATSGTGCPSGQVCRADGSCLAGIDGGRPPTDGPITRGDAMFVADALCADVTLDTSHTTPNVILLVDRSGSMRNDFDGGRSRWDVLQDAIIGMPGGVVPSLQHTVRFGLALFTGSDSMGGTCPDLVTVLPPALDNLGPIATTYTMYGPGSNTPTGESMAQLVSVLGTMTLPPGPTYIILATDGEPNTCADRMDRTGGQMMSEAAAASAQAAGYRVDALGVSTDIALANLMRVATAGGGVAYSVTDTATLVAALNMIIGGAVSCDITLSGMVDPAAACSGSVELAGRPLGCEDPNGWHLVDPTHIVLQGTACAELMSTGGTVTARFPCNAILI